MINSKWISVVMSLTLLLSLMPLSAGAADSVSNESVLKVAVQAVKTEYKLAEYPYFSLRLELDHLKAALPDRVIEWSDEDEDQVSEENVTQSNTVSEVLYSEPQPSNSPSESTTPSEPVAMVEPETGSFHDYYDPALENYDQALDRDVFMENRFVGVEVSRSQLDLYRLLHMYYTQHLAEMTAEELQSVVHAMSLLLTVEMLQAEAIKTDMNSLMSYREKMGLPLKPPSSAQQDVATRHWDTAMSNLEKGIIVSPFVLFHNSLTKSNRVLEIFGVEYSKEHFSIDSDQDELPDVLEFQINTNPYEKDTDHDALRDSFEFRYQLDPLKQNTDDLGLTDPNEDFDSDGLTNLEEQTHSTNPSLDDTDRDGLSDRDELERYHTDPTFSDTDKDQVDDGKEIAIGTLPLQADSDGDGIPDNMETVPETVGIRSEDLDVFKSAGVVPSVIVEGVPGAGEHTRLDDSYHYDVMTEKLPYLVGHPIDLKTSLPFEKAMLSFQLNENAGDVNLNDLRVMWWDEENQQMVMLPNQSVDPARRIVSAETTHFSRFMLIDFTKWFRVMSAGYDPGRPTVLRGPIREFAVATAYEYSQGTLFNYGVANRNQVETSVSRSELNKDLVQNQVFTFGSAGNGYISNAIEKLANNSALTDKWKLLIVASEKRKVDDPNLARALDLAVQHQIKVFTYWTGDQQGDGTWDLEEIAKKTYGEYSQNRLDQIDKSVQMWKDLWGAVKKEEDADADGIPDQVEKEGILLGTGERKFTSTSMEDRNGDGVPDGRDTDGDGLTDGYELGYTDLEGHPLPQASTMPVPALQSSFGSMQSLANVQQRCIGDEYECRSAKVNSAPDYVDTDEDSYSDKVDEKPIEYYQRPIIFMHGVLSNTFTTFGAPNRIANRYTSEERGVANNVDDAGDYTEYLIDLKNQEVTGDYDKEGLYSYLIENAKDPLGRTLYTHGKNMFVFNYANGDRWDNNAEVLNHYVYRLLVNGKLRGPTVGKDYQPIVDFVVHSMGGLVARSFNEQIYPHSIQVGRLITIGTPHTGGNMATFAQAFNNGTLTLTQLTQSLGKIKALDSLSATDRNLVLMNSYLLQDVTRKRDAQYLAIGAVALPEIWKTRGGEIYMPSALKQSGTGGTHTYQYDAGSSDNYQDTADKLIVNSIRGDINSGVVSGPAGMYVPSISDGWVKLDSAFGSYALWELPFNQRWGYIGLAWSNQHVAMHHNVRIKNRVTNMLSR